MVGSALGAWWMISQRRSRMAAFARPDRGTVIFDNTPRANDSDTVI